MVEHVAMQGWQAVPIELLTDPTTVQKTGIAVAAVVVALCMELVRSWSWGRSLGQTAKHGASAASSSGAAASSSGSEPAAVPPSSPSAASTPQASVGGPVGSAGGRAVMLRDTAQRVNAMGHKLRAGMALGAEVGGIMLKTSAMLKLVRKSQDAGTTTPEQAVGTTTKGGAGFQESLHFYCPKASTSNNPAGQGQTMPGLEDGMGPDEMTAMEVLHFPLQPGDIETPEDEETNRSLLIRGTRVLFGGVHERAEFLLAIRVLNQQSQRLLQGGAPSAATGLAAGNASEVFS
ncbi:unnamed protein product [Amoebophrya sp. A120]|nr:unnamed protein product [Amoebophrya sp. A120]|eukprot:GSA120T00017892001.1